MSRGWGRYIWQLPNHKKRTVTIKKDKEKNSALLFIIKTRKWKELKEAGGHNEHSNQFLPPAVFCGASDQRGVRRLSGSTEKALGRDDHCAVVWIFAFQRQTSRYFIHAGRSWREI